MAIVEFSSSEEEDVCVMSDKPATPALTTAVGGLL